jgi:hypothetical protein
MHIPLSVNRLTCLNKGDRHAIGHYPVRLPSLSHTRQNTELDVIEKHFVTGSVDRLDRIVAE